MSTRLSPAGEMELCHRIGTNLRACRALTDLTQAEVAAVVGCAGEVYGRYERGETMPSVPMLVALGLALGVHPGELLGPPEARPAPARASALHALTTRLTDNRATRRLLSALEHSTPGQAAAVTELLRQFQGGSR